MSALLVALETATDVCSVALMQEGDLLGECSLYLPRTHGRNLAPLLGDMMRRADTSPAALNAVVVSMGPGSYTGLRIGVSTAKGLALASGADLVGVPTLEALAVGMAGAADFGDLLAPCLASRGNEVYVAFYEAGDGNTVHPKTEPASLPADALRDRLTDINARRLWIAGPGRSRLASLAEGNAAVKVVTGLTPSAAWVAHLGHQSWQAGRLDDVATFEPFYLKDVAAKKADRTALEKLSM